MKKNLSLLLGMILLGGSILTISFASRDAYHSYLTGKQETNGRFRTFSEGRTLKIKEALLRKRIKRMTTYRGINQSRNLRYSQENTRDTYRLAPKSNNTKTRPSTGAIRTGGWYTPLRRETVTAKNIGNRKIMVQRYENNAFSVQIPKGWNASTEDAHFFTNNKNDFTIRIKKYNANTCSSSRGFMACAIGLSNNENRLAIKGTGKLIPSSRVVRQFQITDGFLNQPKLQTPTYTESFATYFQTKGDQLINRYFVRDLDGGVYLIETQSAVQFKKDSIIASKIVFDSFRIYPTTPQN